MRFRRKPAANVDPPSPPPPDDQPPLCQWRTKGDKANPFLVDGYDCLAFVQSMYSVTSDPAVATSFASLRQSPGSHHIGQFPVDPLEVACRLEYPYTGEVADGVVFRASEMQEKWDIYLYTHRLYFCRSWTGTLVYVAELGVAPAAIVIDRVWVSREQIGSGAELVLRRVDYLIKSHLFRRAVPHPLPKDLPRDAQTVGLYSFAHFGKLCCFGTYEDTLPSELAKPSASRKP
jgi:hypothetical protein